ncbi:Glutamate carboxypeptidase, partial [Globisporangium splendens]
MDSVPYSETFGDPEYVTHTTMAQWWGLLALRLADNAILPFDFSTYALVMETSLAGFEAKLAALKLSITTAKLHDAIALFEANAATFQSQISDFEEKSVNDGSAEVQRQSLNVKLLNLERYLLTDAGLPHRPWYKHVIFGPGFYEGYSGTAFPGIADGIVFGDNATAIQEHVNEVARVVQSAAEYLVFK